MYSPPDNTEFLDIVSNYMEKGFLDNIIDMFRYDDQLYYLIPGLLGDERLRVRIGAVALVESLYSINFTNIGAAADAILPLLDNENAYIVGDALYCLGIIGDVRHIEKIKLYIEDNRKEIQEAAKEAIEEIETRYIAIT